MTDDQADTGVALVMVARHGEKRILTAPGANRRLALEDLAPEAFPAARVLLVQLEAPLDTVIEAVRRAREAGTVVVLDPAPPVALPDDLLRQVDVVRPNAREAEVLTGVEVVDRRTARDAAAVLIRRGAGAAAVQAGDDGNLLLWRTGGRLHQQWMPKLKVRAVDATGAGDALAAALALGIAEGMPLDEAGLFASAAAALKTTKLGAQAGLPTRAEVVEFLGSSVPPPRHRRLRAPWRRASSAPAPR